MDLNYLNDKFTDLKKNLHIFEGRQVQLNLRNKEIIESSKESALYLENKLTIEEFFNKLQDDVHRRTVGSYSKLLTALVQDVLPHNPVKINMNVYTDRGLPALDIFVDSDGKEISIMNGCGGSLNNIVSTGLRVIATAKSKMRRFIFLDEPDCWIKPERVTSYFRILKELCTRMQFQAIVISHNDISYFKDSVDNIISLKGTPVDGIYSECDIDNIQWEENQSGIKSIRLKNFASFKDGILHFSPGINVITGDNNIGKSRVTQAFRTLFYGDTDDGDIRIHEKRADLELVYDDNKTLYWSRGLKRNPVNIWKLTDKNGNTLESINGEKCETGGRNVPEWVKEKTGICRIESLDYQIGNQLSPVFLLNEAPSKRAVVLSMGNESAHLDKIISLFKNKCTQKQNILKNNEKELSNNLRLLKKMENLNQVIGKLDKIDKIYKTIENNNSDLSKLADYGGKLSSLVKTLHQISKYNTTLKNTLKNEEIDILLENIFQVKNLNQQINSLDSIYSKLFILDQKLTILNKVPPVLNLNSNLALETFVVNLANTYDAINLLDKKINILSNLKCESPVLYNINEITSTIDRLNNLVGQIKNNVNLIDGYKNQKIILTDELVVFLEKIDNICPLCNSSIEHHHILESNI